MHESPCAHCSMPDSFPHNTLSGIQICQPQQVRKLNLIVWYLQSGRAGASMCLVPYVLLVGTISNFPICSPEKSPGPDHLVDKIEECKGSTAAENLIKSGCIYNPCEKDLGKLWGTATMHFCFPRAVLS